MSPGSVDGRYRSIACTALDEIDKHILEIYIEGCRTIISDYSAPTSRHLCWKKAATSSRAVMASYMRNSISGILHVRLFLTYLSLTKWFHGLGAVGERPG